MVEIFQKSAEFSKAINNIVCNDCLEIMKTWPDECIDIIITSPPYNLLNSSGNGMKYNGKNNRVWNNPVLSKGYENHADNMPYDEYIAWQQNCLKEMFRLIKKDGAIFYNNKNRVQNGLLEDRSVIVSDLPLRQIITWQRAGGINFNETFFLPTTEQNLFNLQT